MDYIILGRFNYILIIKKVKSFIKSFPGVDFYKWSKTLYNRKKRIQPQSYLSFILHNYSRIKLLRDTDKCVQFRSLCDSVNIEPNFDNEFFYSIDPYITFKHALPLYDNMTVNYGQFIEMSFFEVLEKVDQNSIFYKECLSILDSLNSFINKLRKDPVINKKYHRQIQMLYKMFDSEAETFEESLQRILFINQWLWQTGHMDNGLGHLDWILWPYLKNDLANSILTINDAKELIKSFLRCLHEFYWFKSAQLAGDIGQIIILGGLNEQNDYEENPLTGLFIDCATELKIPDPKVLLRTSRKMSDYLFQKAVNCIETGIGGPVFSNDDVVIPYLLRGGYSRNQVYNYVTAACWEPMIIDKEVEQNNIASLNFARPLVDMCDDEKFLVAKNTDDVINLYYSYLRKYISGIIANLETIRFEKDPFVSVCLKTCVENSMDVSEIKYNFGLTGVGMSTVVNSILNINKLVYKEQLYSLADFDKIRRANYEGKMDLLGGIKACNSYAKDDEDVVRLTNDIIAITSNLIDEMNKTTTYKYKFGLSSPRYIIDSQGFPATFDGRRTNEPFEVHISSMNSIAPTELLSFASKLHFGNSGYNANVVDFILSPTLFLVNKEKVQSLIRSAIEIGVFQIQINVISSKTLIDAQNNPEKHKNLIVRVWGFSAYFVELPKEYQDNLIRRVIASEAA